MLPTTPAPLSRMSRKQKRKKQSLAIAIACAALLTAIAFISAVLFAQGKKPATLTQFDDKSVEKVSTSQPPAEKPPTSSTPNPPKSSPDPTSSVGKEDKPTQAQQAPPTSNQVTFSFVGDVLLTDTVGDVMKQNGYDFPYKKLTSELQAADFTIANLESPFTDKGQKQTKEYVYRSSPLALPALMQAGVDMVNLANNHIMDYGQVGLVDTMDYLDHAGMMRVGAGHDDQEAYKPVIVEKKGRKIAVFGFSRVVPAVSWYAAKGHPGVAGVYDSKRALEAIKKAREEVDLIVVIAHWGEERKDLHNKIQTDLAHSFIDAGADLIVGGHPHVLQGFEQYKGKWIAYSMGNFIFTTRADAPNTWDSGILNASCSMERVCELELIPVFTKWASPERMKPEDGTKLFQRLNKVSIGARIDEVSGKVKAVTPTPSPAATTSVKP